MQSGRIRVSSTIGVLAALLVTGTSAGQSVFWSRDYITDDAGRVIATAVPAPVDQSAPSAPSSLTYTLSSVTSVLLQWSPSNDAGGSGLAGYKIYRGRLPVAAVTGTSFTDNDLVPLSGYTYSIVAFDGAGNHSLPSNSVSFTTAFPPAAPGNLTANAVSDSQINIYWTDNSADESGFKIERRPAGGAWVQIATVGANSGMFASTGLNGATTYYYRVRSYGAGGDSAYSNEAYGTTAAPQPTSLSVSPNSVHRGQCYTLTAGNGANMILDVQYTFNGGAPQQINRWPVLNASGQATICTDSLTAVGTYRFINIRNTVNTSWVPVNVSLIVLPPQPTYMSVSPGSVTQGQCYTITVGNAANMTLDVRYTFNGGAQQQINRWPTLNANGQATVCTDSSTTAGSYAFVAARNTLNTNWVTVYAPITVYAR